jgi:hypothetical protein
LKKGLEIKAQKWQKMMKKRFPKQTTKNDPTETLRGLILGTKIDPRGPQNRQEGRKTQFWANKIWSQIVAAYLCNFGLNLGKTTLCPSCVFSHYFLRKSGLFLLLPFATISDDFGPQERQKYTKIRWFGIILEPKINPKCWKTIKSQARTSRKKWATTGLTTSTWTNHQCLTNSPHRPTHQCRA